MSEKGKAVLSYIFGWLSGLIVLYAIKDNQRNTKFHAAQSIVLSGGYCIISMIYSWLPIAIPFFSAALSILFIVGAIMGIVKAYKEEENPELPLVGGLTKSIFGKKIDE